MYLVEDTSAEEESARRRSSGFALEAALDLSDGTSSIVVLQGEEGAWAAFLPSVLIGQRAVVMLRQQPTESLEALRARVSERLAHADYPTNRLLWVTPPTTPEEELDALRPVLTDYCDAQREVLLVSGENVELMTAEPELEDVPLGPVAARLGRRSSSESGELSHVEAPEESAVRWDFPWEEDEPSPTRSA